MTPTTDKEIDDLAEQVIGCAIEVHRALGPGLLESIYQQCLVVELVLAGFKVDAEQAGDINYKGHHVARALKIDILVEDCLVLELKSVDRIHPIVLAQVITYLKLTDHPAGLLFNFNVTALKDGLRRLEHPDRYGRRIHDRRRAATEEGRSESRSE